MGGEERPEMEVWTIGLSTLLSPMGSFAKSTALFRVVLWLISFKWVGRLLVFLGCTVAALYAGNFTFRGVSIRSRDIEPILVQVGMVDIVIILYWVWPLLADAVNIFYLTSEVVGMPLLVESWKVGASVAVASLAVARLTQGWWFWILGIEVILAVVLLIALTVAAGIMRLWIENVQTQRSGT